MVAGPFWYSGPDFKKANRYRPGEAVSPKGYEHKSFLAYAYDVSGDGRTDILQVSHKPGFHLDLYVQPENAAEDWPMTRLAENVGGESPHFVDVTGDEKPEFIAMVEGRWGFFHADWKAPTEPWKFHKLSDEIFYKGPYCHGLGVGDLNGDGRNDIVWKEGWFEGPGKPLAGGWTHHKSHFSEPGGAQMLIYDVDGDEDNDVVTSLWAHGWGLAWFENDLQDGKVNLKKHLLMPGEARPGVGGVQFTQTHALEMGDFNGDGLTDFVTGKRYWAHNGRDPDAASPAVLYWFELKRTKKGARFIPHLVDTDSGVGTQVAVHDVDGDGLDDIGVGNKKGVFVFRTK
jgi:hypothetical protein